MNDSNNDEPRIVGFESKPIPQTDTTKFLAMTVGAVLLAVFVFCQVTGTSFSSGAIEQSKQLKKTRKKYVSPYADRPSRSLEEIQQYIQENMRNNNPFMD